MFSIKCAHDAVQSSLFKYWKSADIVGKHGWAFCNFLFFSFFSKVHMNVNLPNCQWTHRKLQLRGLKSYYFQSFPVNLCGLLLKNTRLSLNPQPRSGIFFKSSTAIFELNYPEGITLIVCGTRSNGNLFLFFLLGRLVSSLVALENPGLCFNVQFLNTNCLLFSMYTSCFG